MSKRFILNLGVALTLICGLIILITTGMWILSSLQNDTFPNEWHIPGYKFCGPGTNLDARLARGDIPINGLDEACRQHDMAYYSSDVLVRLRADLILIFQAFQRFQAINSDASEQFIAAFVIVVFVLKTMILIFRPIITWEMIATTDFPEVLKIIFLIFGCILVLL